MYKLQWAYICNEDGSPIDVKDMVYNDTVFEYEDHEDAEHDRIQILSEVKDKYIRVVNV